MDPTEIEQVVRKTDPKNYLDIDSSRGLGKEILERRIFFEKRGIIELGSAKTAILPYIFQMEIPFYVGVDPFHARQTKEQIKNFLKDAPQHEGKLTAVPEDGLTYLQRQKEQSAIIVSSGVLDSTVIGCNLGSRSLVEQYKRELAQEIYRVTPAGGVSLHYGIENWKEPMEAALRRVGIRVDENWEDALCTAGFRVDKENSMGGVLFLKQ